jgi:epoxyqueuosine reductase
MVLDSDDLILSAKSLGFSRLGVVALDAKDSLHEEMVHFKDWLDAGYGGEMGYLARHQELRANPKGLFAKPANCCRAIVVTMDYLPTTAHPGWRDYDTSALEQPDRAVISVYAQGRDYHKILRRRLVSLARLLSEQAGHADTVYQFRACVDSAPVLEIALAQRCGLGWRGKHTLLLNREQGSMFFLGVLLTDMPISEIRQEPILPESPQGHCGTCRQCISVCPTQAFVAPYQLDARRCISYLTIEHSGAIPVPLRGLMGNRVYGCDDCQQACPWNRFARVATVQDFEVRNGLDQAQLIELFSWNETEFAHRHQGSAILRIGYLQWLRNIAVAIGNSLARPDCPRSLREELLAALATRADCESEMLREHIHWAIAQANVGT